ncbi:NADH-quinone oxidoreductase subunit C [Melioribacter sp. OK-6-Me]|uniref:hydrogenase large subunit n=1 Tax=unclassified Melioribacter TaxID=2627329 RepID=UPI003ED99044
MNWVEIKNLQTLSLDKIKWVDFSEFRESIVIKIHEGKRLVNLFGMHEQDLVRIFCILADDELSKLFVLSSSLRSGDVYDSITNEVPSAHLFERELWEQFGVIPNGHPWLKPVRHGIAGVDQTQKQYDFFKMSGSDVHEVAVGPIHAGIIEPGHFRFSAHGEIIHNLEIQLGFQHRGVEKLFLQNSNLLYQTKLAESIAGDSVIAHSGTFVRAVESLMNLSIPKRVKIIRSIMLELERIAVHLGDLAAISNDIAYLTGNSIFGALRTSVINTTMSVCGNRFGRNMMKIGGVNFDIDSARAKTLLETINRVENEATTAAEAMFSSASVMERLEKTGIVSKEIAQSIGMVGMAARASGVSLDARVDHPFGAYEFFPIHKLTLDSGDVFARAYIRFIEIQQSVKIINDLMEIYTDGNYEEKIGEMQKNSFVVSITEGWRGEIVHCIITDGTGKIKRIKIKDPSFNNWFALALAVREQGISDFPLCNKSFNLSYCGFDL